MKKLNPARYLSILLGVFLIAAILIISLSSCSGGNDESAPESDSSKTETALTVKVAGLKGPTSIGLVKLMEENENKTSKNSYKFTIAGSADEITPKFIKGDFDIAAIPANLAAVLYNNTEGQIKVIAINTLGVLYIVSKGVEINSLEDLKGKTIYATGKGSTPEYGLKYLLEQNNISPESDLTIEWKSEPTEAVALLSAQETGIAMLPQPYVTVAQNAVEGLEIAINLNDEWNKLDNGSSFITSVVAVRTDFAEKNPQAVADFIAEASASASFVAANVDDGAFLVDKYNIVAEAIAKKAIPYCNLTFITGGEMKDSLSGYLRILYDQNPASVGGALPGDGFYYGS